MTVEFDLLGDPIPENWGKRGRLPHIPTERNRNKVRLLLAFGWTNRRIARGLRITAAPLSKDYFRELRARYAKCRRWRRHGVGAGGTAATGNLTELNAGSGAPNKRGVSRVPCYLQDAQPGASLPNRTLTKYFNFSLPNSSAIFRLRRSEGVSPGSGAGGIPDVNRALP